MIVGCSASNPAFDVGLTGDGSGSDATAMATTTGPPPVTTTASGTTGDDTSTTGATTGDVTATTGVTTGVTTGSSGSATDDSSSGSSTGTPAMCGDGIVDPGEVCDDGPAPVLELGACRPNCAGVIGSRTIFVTKEPVTASFGDGKGIQGADDLCAGAGEGFGLDGEFRAMIVDGARRAATEPYDGDCSDDWPIQRFTAYKNLQGAFVWVTGDVRLLGVRKAALPGDPNVQMSLLAPIDPEAKGVWTGLWSTWQTASHCMQWSGGNQMFGTVGDSSKLVGFLDASGEQLCAADYYLVCVQQ